MSEYKDLTIVKMISLDKISASSFDWSDVAEYLAHIAIEGSSHFGEDTPEEHLESTIEALADEARSALDDLLKAQAKTKKSKNKGK